MSESLPRPLPEWVLERYLLGELPAADLAEVEARVSSDAAEQTRVDALRSSNEGILRRYPPRVVAAAVRSASPRKRRAWVPVLAVVAASAAVVVVWPQPGAPREDVARVGAEDGVRAKGQVALDVVRRVGADQEFLTDGAAAAAGDHLQLSVRSPVDTHAVVVSVDGGGAVTVHTPEPVSVQAGQSVRLPTSYRLDDAPSFERFFVVAGEPPPDVRAVADAAKAAGEDAPLPLGGQFDQASVILDKPRGTP